MRVNDIQTCPILGVNIAAIDINFFIDYLITNLAALKGNYICVSNVHTTVMGFRDEKYMKIQNNSAIAIPDGRPLSLLGNFRGYPRMNRIAGPDVMDRLFTDERFKDCAHYFYGSSEQTLSRLGAALRDRYPWLRVAGMWSPPFRKLTDTEKNEDINRINAAYPDFLWIGLGAPKQEIWMSENESMINALMIGVGAGFDYYAGSIKRAPIWMQKTGLEWLYRLKQDPRRLFGRYLSTNISFIFNAVLMGR